MADRPICEVCGKPEAIYEDYEADLAPPDTLCWAEANGGHSPQHAINALREARAERDRLRALLAAYGRARDEAIDDDEQIALRAIRDEAAKWREWG